MAGYTGMLPRRAIEFAITFAKKNNFEIQYKEAFAVFDESALEVAEDTIDYDQLYSVAWPSNNEIAMGTNEILVPVNVYGDAKLLVYIPYENYRTMFLGSESQKPGTDDNVYWTVHNRKILLEPDASGFTNAVVEFAPRPEAVATAGVDTAINLPLEYMKAVSYKICCLLSPAKLRSLFENIYNDEIKRVRKYKNKLKATGHAQFWNPFEGGNLSRRSGWPGKVTSD